ncbi:MAG: LacI family DNA-binding transcriptional regulator [Terriglobia bacterium]|jgi:LacI family transcriptional regulator
MAGMKDVAKQAGVSVATVSHVMNKTRYVGPETQQRVLEAIRELRYYKDASARQLARGRSDVFGLIVSDVENPFFPEIFKSFESAALRKGFHVLLFNTNYEVTRSEKAIRTLIENRARGVVMMTSESIPETIQELETREIPAVFLNVGQVRAFMSNIRVDYRQGISQAIDHLHSLGHRAFSLIAGPYNLSSAVTRRAAFIDALYQKGLHFEHIHEGNHRADGGADAVTKMLQQARFPTALLCSNDLTAIGAMSALHHHGVRIPEDVSVVGLDDITFSSHTYPPLTTIRISRERLGKLAFEELERILRSKRRQGRECVEQTQLIVRGSTGRARRQDLSVTVVPAEAEQAS